jgi:hypothetical protein
MNDLPNDISDLTPDEREVLGQPGDLVDEPRVPAREKSQSAMFSLRLDRATFDRINEIAEETGDRFSDVVRAALQAYVARHDAREAVSLQSLDTKLDSLIATILSSIEVGGERALMSAQWERLTVSSLSRDIRTSSRRPATPLYPSVYMTK